MPSTIGPAFQCLRAFNVTPVVAENITVEGIDVVVPAYGQRAGFQNVGVAAYQCINLTLRDIRVKGAIGQGTMVSTCRRVLVENCEVEMAPFSRIGGLLYGVEIQFSHYVTLQDHTTIFARYGCTVSRGSTNVTVQRLISKSIHPTGATADIHGGDCQNITFRDFETVTRGLTLGNITWTRGANQVWVENVTGVGIAVIGSQRAVTIEGCAVGQFALFGCSPDTGNGYNNSTGADKGYPNGVDVRSSTIRHTDPSARAPITFTHANGWEAPPPTVTLDSYSVGLRNISVLLCDIRTTLSDAKLVILQRPHKESFTGNVQFEECTFTREAPLPITDAPAFVECYYFFPRPLMEWLQGPIGPVEFRFNLCTFTDSTQTAKGKLIWSQRNPEFVFTESTYVKGTSTLIDEPFMNQTPRLYTVDPVAGSGSATIEAEGDQVWP